MSSRKFSVATIGTPTSTPALSHYNRETRRHSAAPFSFTASLPNSEANYRGTNVPSPSGGNPLRNSHASTVEDAGGDRALFSRMGRKLSTLLPKNAHLEAQGLPVLQIGMRKEVLVVMEEPKKEGGRAANEALVPCKPSTLQTKSSEESIHGLPARGSGISLTSPAGVGVSRYHRRKPVPLSLFDISYHTETQIEQESFDCPNIKPHARANSSIATDDGSSSLHHTSLSGSIGHSPVFKTLLEGRCSTNKAHTSLSSPPPPIPPRSPKRRGHYNRAAAHASSSPTTPSTISTPTGSFHVRSFGTALRTLFVGRVGRQGKMAHNKKRAFTVTRKASLKHKKNKAAINLTYQPHSSKRAPATAYAQEDAGARCDSPHLAWVFSAPSPKRLTRKQKPSLSSFLPFDSRA